MGGGTPGTAIASYQQPEIVSITRQQSTLRLRAGAKDTSTNASHPRRSGDFVAYPGCIKPWVWSSGFGRYRSSTRKSLQPNNPVITEILDACKHVQGTKTVVFAMGFNFKAVASGKTHGSGRDGAHLRIHDDTIKLLQQNGIGYEYVNTYGPNGRGNKAMSTYSKYVNKGHWTAIICHCTC